MAAPGPNEPLVLESPCASQRLARARAFLRDLPSDAGVLLLAPTPAAAQWLVAQALSHSGAEPSASILDSRASTARFNWHRRSFTSLIDELALPELARVGRTRISGLGLLGLCTRLVHREAREGRLGRYARVGLLPGFARALGKTLSELRLARVSSVDLASQDADLAHLLRGYEASLTELALADAADLLSAANLGAARGTRFRGLPLLLLDLPLWHSAEAELVSQLARESGAVFATVPRGDERAQAFLHAALGAACRVERTEPRAEHDLSLLQARLFAVGRSAVPTAQVERSRVTILSSPGESREAVEVVRALHRAASEQVPFDRIAIALRAKDHYTAVVEEALARANIPAHFADGVRRPLPEGRALLVLLECARDGVALRPFAEYLSLAVYPRPSEASEEGPLLSSRWERLLRQASAGGASARWQRRFGWLAAELAQSAEDPHLEPAQRENAEQDRTALRALSAFALPLVEALEQLPQARSWGELLTRLDALAVYALEDAEAVRELLSELAPLSEVAPVTLSEVQRVLSARLSNMTLRGKGHGAGKVFVATPEELRGRSFERVFVMGLAEQLFPPRLSEDPLLPDPVRAQLSPELLLASERAAHERLLLRIAVGAAEQQLSLSYPRVDVEHARPRVPSFYGLEVLHAIDGTLPAFDELTRRASQGAAARMGFPAPDLPELAIDDAEYDLATFSTLLSAQANERVGALRYLLSHAHLARALRFRARRWTLPRFTAADGLVAQDDATRALLARHQLGARAFSASSLASLAACPYRFYLQAICGLRQRDEPSQGEALSARERGVLMHRAQQRLLHDLRRRGALPVRSEQLAAATDVLRAHFAELTREELERRTDASPRLIEEGLASLLHDLQEWLRNLAEDRAFVPKHFELGFGVSAKSSDIDPDSRPTPVVLDKLQLLGVIDLVEQASERDAQGRVQLRVTDHKSGMPEDKLGPFVSGGRALQPLLYALAVEQMFPGSRVDSGRLSYCTARADFRKHDVPINDAARAVFRDLVAAVDSMLSSAFLPAAPRKDACKNCAYLTICGPYEEKERVPQVKARDLARLEALFALRGLP